MKYLITIVLMVHGGLTLAEQFKSWEEHTLAAMEAKLEQENRGVSTIVTVGSDNACDFRLGTTKIQDAIDSEPDEIRIVTDTYVENLNISDISIALVGGFANCTDAANGVSDGNRATVDGDAAATVLQITGNTQRNTVALSNMIFQNGNGSGFLPGGGISTLTADLQLNLDNVWVSNNVGALGGGMAIVGGNTDVSASDFLVLSNTAEQGGGIYCSSSDASILMSDTDGGTAGVFGNTATAGDGGGVFLQSGCLFTTYAGTAGGFFDLRGVASNSATGNGGGVAVESGSTANLIGFQFCFFFCIGNNDEPLNINNNTADSDNNNTGDGGGVWVSGANSVVNARTVLMRDNAAYNGAGATATDGGAFNSSYILKQCYEPGRCNQIIDNEANNRGGAVYALDGGQVDVGISYIQGNRADFGTAGYVAGTDARMDIEGSVITGNGDSGSGNFSDIFVFRANGVSSTNTVLNLAFNTIADNNAITSAVDNVQARTELRSSIVHDASSGNVYSSSSPTTDIFDCVMVHEDASIIGSGGGFQVNVDDPEFIDRVGGDFHINATTSPALDYCDGLATTPDYADIDLEQRGFDDPGVSNISGPFDVGADETYANDIIFEDDFES